MEATDSDLEALLLEALPLGVVGAQAAHLELLVHLVEDQVSDTLLPQAPVIVTIDRSYLAAAPLPAGSTLPSFCTCCR